MSLLKLMRKSLLSLCKERNLSVNEVCALTATSRQTLHNWLDNKPELLEVVLIGCELKKHENKKILPVNN